MCRRALRLLFLTSLAFLLPPFEPSRARASVPRAQDLTGPLRFERNLGQWDSRTRYVARSQGSVLHATAGGLVLRLGAERLELTLRGKPAVEPEGEEPLAGTSSYFLGNDPARWRSGVPHFARLRYRGVAPGVDLLLHAAGGAPNAIELELAMAPGADLHAFEISAGGQRSLRVNGKGDLVIGLRDGCLVLSRPEAFQQGHRVAVAYRLDRGGRISFRLGAHARDRPVIVDPVLTYSTFLGGRGTERANAVTVDSRGFVYVAGYTGSSDFPSANPFQPDHSGVFADAFVLKLDPRTNTLIFATYLGADSVDEAQAIHVDESGIVTIAGDTTSRRFPTTPGAYKTTTSTSDQNTGDVFVTRLRADGSALVYSTYLGSYAEELCGGLAVDASGSAYVTGRTRSLDFPTTPGAFQTNVDPHYGPDAFVTKLDPAGSRLVFSTILAGGGDEMGMGIALDAAGGVHVTGKASGYAQAQADWRPFPLESPFQATPAGYSDAFVLKLDPAGTALVWSSFLGGTADETARAVAVDGLGNVYVAGDVSPSSSSSTFPTTVGAVKVELTGTDIFVTKVRADGTAVVFSTLLGGGDTDVGVGLAVDATGSSWIVGETFSADYPLASPLSARRSGERDACISRLDPTGTTLLFSSYLGGSGREFLSSVALDASGAAWVAGATDSAGFPLVSPYQAVYAGPSNAFYTGDVVLCRIDPLPDPETDRVPIVLTSSGASGSYYTTELALTNRGTTTAALDLTYTAAFGGGSGSATDTLAPGRQRVVPDAIAYLRSLGVPIPETGNRGGTLTVRFSGLSAPSARAITVRTTTAVAGGRAGLAYPAVATRERLTDTVWICGLRQTGEDRSNVALVNMGGPDEGDVTLRLRIYSASSRGPVQTLPDETLPPGGWKQLDQLLAGKAVTSGFVEVQRVSGSAPFYAYGIVNDQVNSDGSFVPPYRDTSHLGDGLTLPVVVETAAYSSEVVLTNTSSTARSLRLTYVDEALTTGDRKAVLVVPLAAFEQLVIPSFHAYLRSQGVAGVGPPGPTYAGALFATPETGTLFGVSLSARTSTAGGGGRYGLFYTATPYGQAATSVVWLHGLRQDAENRTNLALVNTGEKGNSTDVFRIEVFDGDTGALVATLDDTSLPARRWKQLTAFLTAAAPGTSQAYARITRVSGTNPFLAYAVINDGAAPGERSGDGAFVSMRVGN